MPDSDPPDSDPPDSDRPDADPTDEIVSGIAPIDAGPAEAVEAPPPLESGPPGGGVFSLEGRAAPGLYLVAWVLSVGGGVLLFLVPLASSEFGRVVLLVLGGVFLTFGLAAGAGSQMMERRSRSAERYRGPAPLLLFGVVLAASTLLSGLLVATDLLDPERPLGFLLGLLLVALGYGVAVWLFVVKGGALSWQEMGWLSVGPARLRRGLRSIGVAIAVMVPITFAISIVGGLLALLLDVEAPAVLPTAESSFDALAVALGVAIVAPIGEELFFRGFALTAWLRDLGPRAAIGRSAVFFALIHIVNIQSASFGEGAAQALLQTAVILPLGLVLGWLFLRQGLLGAVAGHVTYNSLLLFLLFLRATLPESA